MKINHYDLEAVQDGVLTCVACNHPIVEEIILANGVPFCTQCEVDVRLVDIHQTYQRQAHGTLDMGIIQISQAAKHGLTCGMITPFTQLEITDTLEK